VPGAGAEEGRGRLHPSYPRQEKSLHFCEAIYFSEYNWLKSGKKVKSARSKNKRLSLYKGCFVTAVT